MKLWTNPIFRLFATIKYCPIRRLSVIKRCFGENYVKKSKSSKFFFITLDYYNFILYNKAKDSVCKDSHAGHAALGIGFLSEVDYENLV